MSGTFGYELDPGKLSAEEKAQIRAQIALFSELYDLIQNGEYYRLDAEKRGPAYSAWEFVAPDKAEALLCLVVTHPESNPAPLHLRWQGLDENASYRVWRREFFGCALPIPSDTPETVDERPTLSGSALLHGGYTLPRMYGDYPSVLVHLKKA